MISPARLAGPAAVALGTALLAVAALGWILPAASQPAALVPVMLLAVGGGTVALLRPRWVLPAWAGLTWASIGEHWFGGLSPVQMGAIALVVAGLWRARADVVVLRRTALVCALIGLPAIAAGLLAADGSGFPVQLLRTLPFLAVGALVVRDDEDVELLATGLTLAGLFLGAGAVWSVLVGPSALFAVNESSAVFDYEAPRAAGPFGEANFFALSLAVLLPFAVHLVRRGGAHAVLGLTASLALGAGIMATGSRGGAVAAAVGLFAFALMAGGRTARVMVTAAVLVTLALVPLFAEQTVGARGRATEGRLTENQVALAMFADHPVTGIGPGGYTIAYRDYARGIGSDPRVQREPHSLPLEILSEQGLAGALGWLTALAVVGSAVAGGGLRRRVAGQPLIAALIAYGAGSLFLHGSQLRLLMILLGVALAAGLASRRQAVTP